MPDRHAVESVIEIAWNTQLALDMAVAVATGTPCLRQFVVPRAGRVLLFAAEDALHIVRHRLEGICRAAGAALANVDVQVITARGC